MSLIFIVLILIYFLGGFHQKVLNHFGLTERDDKLIFIGFFIPGFISSLFMTVAFLIAGNFGALLMPVLHLLICGVFIYLNYQRL